MYDHAQGRRNSCYGQWFYFPYSFLKDVALQLTDREEIMELALFGVGRAGTVTHRLYFMLPFILVSWYIYSLLLTQYCQMN